MTKSKAYAPNHSRIIRYTHFSGGTVYTQRQRYCQHCGARVSVRNMVCQYGSHYVSCGNHGETFLENIWERVIKGGYYR